MQIKILLLLFTLLIASSSAAAAEGNREVQFDVFLKDLFHSRTQLLINQRPDTISRFYNLTQDSSNKAYQNELINSMYINTWSNIRGIVLLEANGEIDIEDKKITENHAEVYLKHSIYVSYVYDKKLFPIESFALGTQHKVLLKKQNDSWIVVRDLYANPIGKNPDLIPKGTAGSIKSITPVFTYQLNKMSLTNSNKIYNRKKAISYADKYAGTSLGVENKNPYNPKYNDYSALGGDCTNFVSQVLAEAGGLPMNTDWAYNEKGVTKSWSHTDSLKDFLLNSHYGNVVGYGHYKEMVKPTDEHPNGSIYELQPGDLIGYEENGDLVHFSIITGFDTQGYPLVNSHTADRYHVPWDLGWNENTKFWLFHITY